MARTQSCELLERRVCYQLLWTTPSTMRCPWEEPEKPAANHGGACTGNDSTGLSQGPVPLSPLLCWVKMFPSTLRYDLMERHLYSYKYWGEVGQGPWKVNLWKELMSGSANNFLKSFYFYIFTVLRIEHRASRMLDLNSTFELHLSSCVNHTTYPCASWGRALHREGMIVRAC